MKTKYLLAPAFALAMSSDRRSRLGRRGGLCL